MENYLSSAPKLDDIHTLGMQSVTIPHLVHIDKFRSELTKKASELLGIEIKDDEGFLNQYHNHFNNPMDLNEHRVKIMKYINGENKFRELVFQAFKPLLEPLLGCDIAMQKRINLVIQIPDFPEENLHIHSDVEAGNSPFEITLWIPFVNVFDSKSMFIYDRSVAESVIEAMKQYKADNLLDLGNKLIRPEHYLNMKYGEALLFNPFLLHGNTVNTTSETRWTLNVRLKSLFSPYGTKDFGEYFDPIQISPLTRLGLEYYKTHSL